MWRCTYLVVSTPDIIIAFVSRYRICAVIGKFYGLFPSTSSEPPQIRRALKSLWISLRAGIVKGSIKKREESRPNKSDQKSGHPGESRTIGKSHSAARLNRRLRNRSINHSISLIALLWRYEIGRRRKKIWQSWPDVNNPRRVRNTKMWEKDEPR